MFNLNILTPEKELYSGKAEALTATAVDGEIGILVNHAPLITVLKKGFVRYRKESGEETTLKSNDGLLSVHNNRVTVLL